MPRSLLVPARRCSLHGVQRWAAILLLVLLVQPVMLHNASAATITSLLVQKNGGNTGDYSQTGPRREFRSEVATMYNQPDTFCVRYASVLAVDVAALGNTEQEDATSSYQISFSVAAATNEHWTIKLWSHRKGEYTIIDDNGGQASASIVTSITATSNTGNSLAALQFAGGSEDNHSNKANDKHGQIHDPSVNQWASALIDWTGPKSVTLNFTWSEKAISDPDGSLAGGDEAAIRLGLSTIGINRISAGDYEALNDRIKADDGHFVCAKLCAPPTTAVTAASFCSPLDNSSCSFTATGHVYGCLGNCYTVVCKFYNKNGALVSTATTSVTNGSLTWVASATNSGPCSGAPYTMTCTLADDACAITSESILADLIEELPYITVPVEASLACAGNGGSINMPATTSWGRITMGVGLLLAGVLLIRRRHARHSG